MYPEARTNSFLGLCFFPCSTFTENPRRHPLESPRAHLGYFLALGHSEATTNCDINTRKHVQFCYALLVRCLPVCLVLKDNYGLAGKKIVRRDFLYKFPPSSNPFSYIQSSRLGESTFSLLNAPKHSVCLELTWARQNILPVGSSPFKN